MNLISNYIPFFIAVTVTFVSLFSIYQLFLGKKKKLSGDKKFPRQIAFMLLMFVALWVLVLFLPIDANYRAEISTILGVIFSALFALSSTTILSNLMAGIVLRITQPFSIGDFIRIEEHFGRVSERGLFDTELQTEERAFVSIPNAYLIKNPINAIHASGTVVSVNLSLGYDVHHQLVEQLLLVAAEKTTLEKPFVHILALGDFSVTYRISGFLQETKNYVSFKSNLFANVLDELHGNGVEILSPNYMSQRQSDPTKKLIPIAMQTPTEKKNSAETVIFDKAEKAENIERFRKQLLDDISLLEIEKKSAEDDNEKAQISKRITEKESLLNRLAMISEKPLS